MRLEDIRECCAVKAMKKEKWEIVYNCSKKKKNENLTLVQNFNSKLTIRVCKFIKHFPFLSFDVA